MPPFHPPQAGPAFVLIFFAALMLAGCGHTVSEPPILEPAPLGPMEAFLAAELPGQSIVLDDPEFGENIRVTVEDMFVSANGEHCKRGTVLSSHGNAEVVVICRDKNGYWKMAPRVWGHAIEP